MRLSQHGPAERRARTSVLPVVSRWLGLLTALVGAGHLAAWLGGILGSHGLHSLTVKTNAAVYLLLLGLAMTLGVPSGSRDKRRWLAIAFGILVAVGAALTLSENLLGWDLHIDQLIATEPPGGVGVTSPNRMGTPGAAGLLLAGLALANLWRNDPRGAVVGQRLALGVCIIGLLPAIGYLYAVQRLYDIARLTATAWPMAAVLLVLGVGLLAARPHEGLMTQVTAGDPGGSLIRRLLLPMLLLPLLTGWLRLAGERQGWVDPGLGTALVILLFMISFSALLYAGARRVSRSSAAVTRSEAQFRAVVENLAEGLIVASPDGRLNHWNEAALQMHGFATLEECQRHVSEFADTFELATIDGAVLPQEDWPLPRILRGERLRDWEVRIRRLQGDWHRVYSYGGALVRDASGLPTMAIVTVSDISTRKRAEEDLRRSEEHFRSIFESAAAGIALIDLAAGRLLRVNRQLAVITGYSEAELLQGMTLLALTHPDERAEAALALSRVRSGEITEAYFVERRYIRKDAEIIHVELHGSVVHDTAGQPAVATIVLIDATARKQAERELAAAKAAADQARSAAEDASRAKDHFLSVLSHELRTPLSPVLTGVSLLERETGVSARGREVIDVIRRNIELESRLIDDLLDLTRITRGKVELVRRRVDLRTVIERAVEVCHADIEARHLHFGVDYGPRPYLVDADAARLQQVFWNLLKNAVKFTPKGGCVGLRCHRDDGHVVVEVLDSGIGIEASALGAIFDAFAQAERSITRQFGGLGLGLAICKALVEMHGGTIEARSEGRDKGATFVVRLPLVLAGPTEEWCAPAKGEQHAARRALSVLLVEDHGDTAEILSTVLALAGHRVQTAADVASALEAVSQQDFDLLVSDLGLPDRSGLDLMRELRASGRTIPGIALSGYGQDSDIQQSRAAGYTVHLVKPAEPDLLLEAMDRVVGPPGSE